MERRRDPRSHRQEDRPIRGTGQYNLNFIDWDNEFEAVCDHVYKLQCNCHSAQGKRYEDEPYYSVPYDEVRMFFETVEAEDDPTDGMTDAQIAALPAWRGTAKQCSICLDTSGDGLVLPCGHIFHRACISRWLRCHRT